MATIDTWVLRTVFETVGQGSMGKARKQVKDVNDSVYELNATLAAASLGFLKFSQMATRSFGEIETAMSKFASRAGWELGKFTNEFEQAINQISRLTGVRHTLVTQAMQEGLSQGSLQGMEPREIKSLVREAAKLHAAGQADLRHTVSSAITSRQYGAPTATWGQRLIYSASQVGAGDPAQYGKEYKDIAPGMNFLNVEQSEGLGALALIAGAAPSLAEGATWIKALLRTLSNPQDDARSMFEERTGMEFRELQDMFGRRGGMVEALNLIGRHFKGPEIVSFFGRQEAAQGFAALTAVPGQLLDLQKQVRENAIDDPVARAWGDNIDTWRVSVERFGRSLDTFLRSFGAPLVAIMRQGMKIASWTLDQLTRLNDLLFGLPGVLGTLTAGVLALAGAVNAVRFVLDQVRNVASVAGGGLGGIGTALFGRRFDGRDDPNRKAREDERDARERKHRWGTTGAIAGADFVSDMVSGAVFGNAESVGKRVSDGLFDSIKGGKTRNYGESVDHWEEMQEAQAQYERVKRAEARKGRTPSGGKGGSAWTQFINDPLSMRHPDAAFEGQRRGREWRQAQADKRARGKRDPIVRIWDWMMGFEMLAGAKDRAAAIGGASLNAASNIGGGIANAFIRVLSANPKTALAVGMTTAVIGGFKWWYKKTENLGHVRDVYRLAGNRSNALNILNDPENQASSMRDVDALGDIDIATFEARGLKGVLARADALLKSQGEFSEGVKWWHGTPLHRFMAWDEATQKSQSAQIEYTENLIELGKKVKLLERAMPDHAETQKLRARYDAEIEQNGNWFRRAWRRSMQQLFPSLPGSMTDSPGTKGPLDMWHIPATEDFMKRFGHALVSEQTGVISDALVSQVAWAKDPELKAAEMHRDGVALASLAAQQAEGRKTYFDMLKDNPGIKIEINIGTVSEASVDDVRQAVHRGLADAANNLVEATNSPAN